MYATTGNTALTSWGSRHARLCTGVRIAAGTWNLLLGIFFVSHGHPWGAVLFVTSALIFVAAYALAPRSRSRL